MWYTVYNNTVRAKLWSILYGWYLLFYFYPNPLTFLWADINLSQMTADIHKSI